MSRHLGDYDTSTVVYGKFTTYRPSTGAPYTLAGTPALSVYKDDSTTQSTTGVTLTADFDTVTGLNHFAIDTSADGTFYAAGSFFYIVVTAGTVDSVSAVGTVVASFTLRKDSALKPTTAARTLDVTATGEAGIDWSNVGAPTTTLNLSGTTVSAVSGAVGSVTGAVGSVTGLTASDVGAIKTKTDYPPSVIAGGAGGVFIAGTNAATTITTALTTTFTGNLTGSVASVTGAVGSVTGAVGSVTGAVGSVTSPVTAGTVSDKTGYALTQTFPTNFSALVVTVGGAVTAGTVSDKTGYALTADYDPAKTAAQAGDAMALTTAAYAAAADKLLGRNLAGSADGTRTVQDALRLLRNKTAVATGTLTVYAEDDTTPAWTAAVETTAGDPISSVDPA